MTDKQSANQTGIVPDERVSWVKNPLITQIRFHAGTVGSDYVEIRYFLTQINPSDSEVKWTAMPTPDGPRVRLYCKGKQVLLSPPAQSGIEAYRAAPRDEDIKANANLQEAKSRWTDGPIELVIMNSQLLVGTHIYEVVYWHTQLDWIDVREVLDRTDSQGKGGMMYPITDNAPSNRLYFKVYKPTDDEARQGRHIEFLGEVDARTQVPALPYTRPGDFAPKTGYWSATGKSIERLGGYHEVFVREGDSMPNLPGDKGVDPFSFQWKYVGEHSQASVQ
ncbi:hypothetical protein [Paraburkholderia strydomiana]|uniref:hypothetical protein n=1 Tax=Paraburkholderia strydomiana TaxID=1245417 RepID=UPI001BEC8326|nr:hypothetical protein [Paraburkholderia strydomiana]MBT2793218.1 hypothetical protein [Paraburkholderia strydomiana]